MDDQLLALFEREVARQAKFALWAADGLDEAITTITSSPAFDTADFASAEDRRAYVREHLRSETQRRLDAMERLWMHVQTLLVYAGNVSKLLWGVNKERRRERRPVREALEIGDDSPLEDRRLRDHFEHFDERLVRWRLEGHSHFSDSNVIVSQQEGDEVVDAPGRYALRNFDIGRREALFYDDRFALTPIIDALRELAPRADRSWRQTLGIPEW